MSGECESACTETMQALDVFLDGELADYECAEVAMHLEACSQCQEALKRRERTRSQLTALGADSSCSVEFHGRLAGALGDVSLPANRESVRTQSPVRWMAAAGVTIVLGGGVFAAGSVMPAFSGLYQTSAEASGVYDDPNGPAPAVVDESVRWHARQVPVEVTGPNPAVVRDWFADKVSFPVLPPELSARAHLVGGRLGNVERSDAAFLLYDIDGARLSVMVFDPARAPRPRTAELQAGRTYIRALDGYNVAVREHEGIAYSFTSQLEEPQLAELVNTAFSY
jgi:anti-sigma factor RsiW